MERTRELMTKIYLPLPIDVGKVMVWGRRQNSVCGLSFGDSRGGINELNFLRCRYKTYVKNGKDTRTHHKNISTTAYCCWQGGGVWREAKLSLWAEFRPFLW